jgi:hypothetical protein
MKRFTILAVAIALAVSAGSSFAQGGFQINTLPRLKFITGAGTAPKDTISILGMTTSSTVVSTEDTTAWYDVGNLRFAQGAASMPMISAQINTTVAADSIGYYIQWQADDNDATKVTAWSSVAYAVGGLGNVVSIAQSSAEIGRKFRMRIWANDTGGVVHTYSIVPIVRIAR